MSDLKPCPFCGKQPERGSNPRDCTGGGYTYIKCCDSPFYGTNEQWNTRPREAELEGVLREARIALNGMKCKTSSAITKINTVLGDKP